MDFHSFPIRIGNFIVTNIGKAKAHVKEVLDYKFKEIGARKYDLNGIFEKHYKLQAYHEVDMEDKYYNPIDYYQVAYKCRGIIMPPTSPKYSQQHDYSKDEKGLNDTQT